jgi:hypothetical protein
MTTLYQLHFLFFKFINEMADLLTDLHFTFIAFILKQVFLALQPSLSDL